MLTVVIVFGVAIIAGGIVLLVKGLRHRTATGEQHCRKCDYNLTGSTSPICPECGTERTAKNVVYGEKRRRPGLLIAGSVLCLVGVLACLHVVRVELRGQVPQFTITGRIQFMKSITAGCRSRYQAGTVHIETPVSTGPGHIPEYLLAAICNSTVRSVKRCVTNPNARIAALSELQALQQFMEEQFIPQFKIADESNKWEDIRALLPLLDQIDKQLDALLKTVKGY